ncbi:MAG: non-hydrolyzing UDP-N-acetylglucosamine 2-epimerase [Aggregatilineales bacterium]
MPPQTVLSIFGTRPETTKMIPVFKALAQQPDTIRSVVCFTGQHRDTVAPILELFDVDPDIQLDVMTHNQTLTGLTTRLLTELEQVISDVQPDWILAQGDTTSVMVSSLLAYYHRIKFGHIEAGLRTGDKYQPYPEEGNRVIADLLADMCFAPTAQSRLNLLAQGIPEERIVVTGNTAIDALHLMAEKNINSPLLEQFADAEKLVLITAHRRENFGAPLLEICRALCDLAAKFPDVTWIYPVHPNPNVHDVVQVELANIPNMHLLPPVDYQTMVGLMRRAVLILTDSGGLQEEAPAFNVPVLVMRDKTERTEGPTSGIAHLVGTNYERIMTMTAAGLRGDLAYDPGINPYGDGQAAQRIVDYLRASGAQQS